MENLTLFQIKEEYKQLLLEMEEEIFTTGQISETTSKSLTVNKEQLLEKIDNYQGILNMLDARIKMADTQIEKAKAFKNRQDTMIQHLQYNLLQALLLYGEEDKRGVRSLEVGLTKLSTRRSKYVEIEDSKEIPDKYISVSLVIPKSEYKELLKLKPSLKSYFVEEIIHKADIKKSDKPVSGAKIEEKIHLSIK